MARSSSGPVSAGVRERALIRTFWAPIYSVYLTTEIESFLRQESPISPWADSVTISATTDGIQFWGGGSAPQLLAEIGSGTPISVRMECNSERFDRPILQIYGQEIPLYASGAWLGLSRSRSRALYAFLSSRSAPNELR